MAEKAYLKLFDLDFIVGKPAKYYVAQVMFVWMLIGVDIIN